MRTTNNSKNAHSGNWPRRIVILNFTGMRENWGCQATSWEFADFLRQSFDHGQAPEITMVPLPPRHFLDHLIDRRHGNRIERILADPAPNNDDLDFLERLATRRFCGYVDTVKSADLVVFQGEGTLGRAEFVRGVRLLALPFLAKLRWNKPVIAANLSVFDAQGTASPLLANVLGLFDVLAVREPVSLSYCRAIGLAGTLLCPDMAFLSHSPQGEAAVRPAPGGRYFCVTGSAALRHYPIKRYVRMIEDLAVRLGLQPVILHAKRRDAWIRDYARALWRRVRPVVVSRKQCPGYRDLMPVLRDAAFVVGGRYHLSILAAAVGTAPILLPGNTYKTQGLARLIGPRVGVHDIADEAGLASEAALLVSDAAGSRARMAVVLGGLRDHIAVFAAFLAEAAPALLSGDRTGLARLLAAPHFAALVPVTGDIAVTTPQARLHALAHSAKPRLRLRQMAMTLARPRPLQLAAALYRGLNLRANLRHYACERT